MKIKFNKKTVTLGSLALVAAIMAGSLSTISFKEDAKAALAPNTKYTSVTNDVDKAMETVSKMYAENFAENVNEDVDLEVSDTVPIYDKDDCVIGYSVAFNDENGQDYGYVNLDYTSDTVVSDFSVTDKSDSLYDALAEDFASKDSDVEQESVEEKLISVNGADYAVESEEKFYYNGTTYEGEDFEDMLNHYEENYLEYYDNTEYEDDFVYEIGNEDYNEEYDKEEKKEKIADKFKKWLERVSPKLYDGFFGAGADFVKPTAYPDHGEVFKDEAEYKLDKEVMLPQYSKELSLISQETIMKTTNKYACELVGITAICQQEGMMLYGNLKDTFDMLWNLADCDSRIYETDIFYDEYLVECSGTITSQMDDVVKEYATLFDKKVKTSYRFAPGFNFFKNSIDKGNSTSFGYVIKGEGGHGVNVVGYAEGKVGFNDINYLITGDSWYDDAPRYVLYKRSLFMSSEGLSFEISDM